jgi:hypothetical protein
MGSASLGNHGADPFIFLSSTLPLGVHFFCLPKRNRTKEKGTLIALLPKT